MAHLFVIAGHGAGDCGAVGCGYTEAERVRYLAARLAALGGSNVTVADTNRNWYADNGIMSLNIPKDYQILELHMDSASASANGGHVIIEKGYNPDKYDNALANFISSFFPGRSEKIKPTVFFKMDLLQTEVILINSTARRTNWQEESLVRLVSLLLLR